MDHTMNPDQVFTIVFILTATVIGSFTIAMIGILRSINEHQQSVERTIDRGTQEHKEWREEMKAINEKVTEISIQQAVEKELRKRKKRRKRKA